MTRLAHQDCGVGGIPRAIFAAMADACPEAFISPHALERFRQRVPGAGSMGDGEAINAIRACLAKGTARARRMADGTPALIVRDATLRIVVCPPPVSVLRTLGPLARPVVVTVLPGWRGTSAGRGRVRRPDRERA